MAQFIAEGNALDFTPSGADVVSGELVVIGDILGIANGDIPDGKKGSVQVEGVIELETDGIVVAVAGTRCGFTLGSPGEAIVWAVSGPSGIILEDTGRVGPGADEIVRVQINRAVQV